MQENTAGFYGILRMWEGIFFADNLGLCLNDKMWDESFCSENFFREFVSNRSSFHIKYTHDLIDLIFCE